MLTSVHRCCLHPLNGICFLHAGRLLIFLSSEISLVCKIVLTRCLETLDLLCWCFIVTWFTTRWLVRGVLTVLHVSRVLTASWQPSLLPTTIMPRSCDAVYIDLFIGNYWAIDCLVSRTIDCRCRFVACCIFAIPKIRQQMLHSTRTVVHIMTTYISTLWCAVNHFLWRAKEGASNSWFCLLFCFHVFIHRLDAVDLLASLALHGRFTRQSSHTCSDEP